jgi:hypothetical protein
MERATLRAAGEICYTYYTNTLVELDLHVLEYLDSS